VSGDITYALFAVNDLLAARFIPFILILINLNVDIDEMGQTLATALSFRVSCYYYY
jgi:hypothetical protein